MRHWLRSSFTFQFVGGFVLGAIGLAAMHPAGATREAASRLVPTTHAVAR